jgi:hypothetical protein
MSVESIPSLRPMRMGQILDQAARLYRNNFVAFMGIVAVVQVPIAIIQILINLGPSSATSTPIVSLGGYFLSLLLTFIFVQGIGTAAMTRAVADNYLGEKTGALDAYRKIGRRWLSLLAALFILGLIGIVAGLWGIIVPCIGWFTGLGILVYLWIVISPLVAPIIVLERANAAQGWRRAWELARQRFWWMLGFFVVLYLFNLLVVLGPTTLAIIILSFTAGFTSTGPTTSYAIQVVIEQVVSTGFSLVFLPFQLAATTLVYLDLRVRSEGFDLAVRAHDGGGERLIVAELMSAAPPADHGSLPTRRELAYFAGLTLIPVGLYFALTILFALLLVVFQGVVG